MTTFSPLNFEEATYAALTADIRSTKAFSVFAELRSPWTSKVSVVLLAYFGAQYPVKSSLSVISRNYPGSQLVQPSEYEFRQVLQTEEHSKHP